MLSQQDLKQQAADAALALIEPLLTAQAVIGVGTGSTADLFIDGLAAYRSRFRGDSGTGSRP
jgi:ribose 5-phosphate isomerase A